MMRRQAMQSVACLGLAGRAVAAPPSTEPPLLPRIATLLREQYVDAAIGARTASALLEQGGAHARLAERADWSALADALSADLRRWSGDQHLGVVHDATRVRKERLRATAVTDPRAVARQQEIDAEESRLDHYGLRGVENLAGGVGYLRLDYFDRPSPAATSLLAAAMNMLAGSEALLIDLRRNGGGNSKILPQFMGHLLGPAGRAFAIRQERWRGVDEPQLTAAVAGECFHTQPLYLLISGTTFSLAEHFAYHLRAQGRAVLVGERSYGGAMAWDPVVLNDALYLRLPRVRFVSTVTGRLFDEGQGLSPDVPVPARHAREHAHCLALRRLLATDADPAQRRAREWALRVAEARLDPPRPDMSAMQRGEGRFGEHRFQRRGDELWYFYRDLPAVLLEPLDAHTYLDDRAIQRQFRFAVGANEAGTVDVLDAEGQVRSVGRSDGAA